jgi:hypothetical protein
MEHLVRVQNERDRRTLEWLRERLSDEAITTAALNCGGASKPFLSAVCRSLGVTPPHFTPQRRWRPSAPFSHRKRRHQRSGCLGNVAQHFLNSCSAAGHLVHGSSQSDGPPRGAFTTGGLGTPIDDALGYTVITLAASG